MHGEEKREREIEVTRRRKGGVKRGKSNLASKQFPMCSPVWKPQRDSQSYMKKREGGGK